MKYSLEEIKKLIKIIYNEHFKCSISMIIYSDDFTDYACIKLEYSSVKDDKNKLRVKK